ncbi:MAG: S1/P1 Nuclease [Planctomycetota bacterium]
MRSRSVAALAVPMILVGILAGTTHRAWAWGATGHEWVSGIAIEKLPDDIPAFVRTPEAIGDIAVMGRELDRSKGSGRTHDAERDPGHSLHLADDASVMGVLPLGRLPATREEYDTLLRAKGYTQYRAGYLPYAIVDGWQQIRKDFAYWRAAVKGAETATTPAERAWFENDRRLREKLTLRDIGIWSHYVGDATQPMHVSVHNDGWGGYYPNPNGYTTAPVHAYFEGAFVVENLQRPTVIAEVGPYKDCKCSIEEMTRTLLLASLAQVDPLYALEKAGGFKKGDLRGIQFATTRLAAGAQAARDMIVAAWIGSASTPVGYPPVNVRDILSGKVRATRELFGND